MQSISCFIIWSNFRLRNPFIFYFIRELLRLIVLQKVAPVKNVNLMLYLHKFVKRKNMGLSKSIVSISLFIPLKEKPYGPFKERSLWTSTTKSTDNVIGNRNLQTRICHFAFFFLSFFFSFFFLFCIVMLFYFIKLIFLGSR